MTPPNALLTELTSLLSSVKQAIEASFIFETRLQNVHRCVDVHILKLTNNPKYKVTRCLSVCLFICTETPLED